MTIDTRFALIADNGDVLYPYIRTERSAPRRTGFFISRPGQKGLPEVTSDLRIVVERVVVDGWSVRARTDPATSPKREGVFGLGKSVIHDFKLAPEVANLLPSLLERAGRQFRAKSSETQGASGLEGIAEHLADSGDAPDAEPWIVEAAEREVDSEFAGADIDASTRKALIDARIGQGGYRRELLALWGSSCSVTGCSVTEVLIASHAKAWSSCESTKERLDKYNGLLLNASIDRLFDRGLISFADDGHLLIKPKVPAAELVHLGLRTDARLRADCLHPRHLPYLAAHRARHGF